MPVRMAVRTHRSAESGGELRGSDDGDESEVREQRHVQRVEVYERDLLHLDPSRLFLATFRGMPRKIAKNRVTTRPTGSAAPGKKSSRMTSGVAQLRRHVRRHVRQHMCAGICAPACVLPGVLAGVLNRVLECVPTCVLACVPACGLDMYAGMRADMRASVAFGDQPRHWDLRFSGRPRVDISKNETAVPESTCLKRNGCSLILFLIHTNTIT